jgi:hypothetical protein
MTPPFHPNSLQDVKQCTCPFYLRVVFLEDYVVVRFVSTLSNFDADDSTQELAPIFLSRSSMPVVFGVLSSRPSYFQLRSFVRSALKIHIYSNLCLG